MAPPRHALLLTAGLGTRLRPLTHVRAKAAMPVAGDPMIRRIIRPLVEAGVTDLVLNLHHRPETIARLVGDGSDLGARVRYSWEQPQVLGSAGGPRQALDIVGAETFLLINGDTLATVDLDALARAHAATGALVTLALVAELEPSRYGGVTLDGHRRVTGFVRRGSPAIGAYHFVGVQLVAAEVFQGIPAGQAASTIGGVYEALLARDPGAICGFVTHSSFVDVGTPADYWSTSRTLAADADVNQIGQCARIHPSARVTRSILWDGVTVGRDASVDECIVADGATVPEGASYRRAIVRRADGTPDPGERVESGVVVSPLRTDGGTA